MNQPQLGILPEIPNAARYLEFRLKADAAPSRVLSLLASQIVDDQLVIGLSSGFVGDLGHSIDGLREFPRLDGPSCQIPLTQADLLFWIRGESRGAVVLKSLELIGILKGTCNMISNVDGFKHEDGRDLTGYEDGTENPKGNDAREAAIVGKNKASLSGSSFVAIQKWVHDLTYFNSLTLNEQNNIFGRNIADNEEIENAPASAHIKRTEQESFDPEAFILRRSMMWATSHEQGMMFVAFGASFEPFEAQLSRMAGLDDGILDALFSYSRPVSGGYYWCPPAKDNRLDLTAISI